MMKKNPIRILCIGAGNMGRSHALAYHRLDGFEIVGPYAPRSSRVKLELFVIHWSC